MKVNKQLTFSILMTNCRRLFDFQWTGIKSKCDKACYMKARLDWQKKKKNKELLKELSKQWRLWIFKIVKTSWIKLEKIQKVMNVVISETFNGKRKTEKSKEKYLRTLTKWHRKNCLGTSMTIHNGEAWSQIVFIFHIWNQINHSK